MLFAKVYGTKFLCFGVKGEQKKDERIRERKTRWWRGTTA